MLALLISFDIEIDEWIREFGDGSAMQSRDRANNKARRQR
jgi:hypothetical protein